MSLIELKDVGYSYNGEQKAVDGISFSIEKGSYTTIIGHNGSGKSTLAKLMAGLLPVQEGSIHIDSLPVSEENMPKIRERLGIVFQNPDNQFIGSTVRDDIAFGLENRRIASADMEPIIDEYAQKVGLSSFLDYEPQNLSGGQKQRVAIAGVMAMLPKCIIMDEPTAMLDPNGRKEVIRSARELNQTEGVTVILITHYMEEVIDADAVFVMQDGRIVLQGTPKEIFSQVEKLKELRLDVPQVTLLAHELRKSGVQIPEGILTAEELAGVLCR